MGKLTVTIAVGDSQGREFQDLEVTAGTGSTLTAVPTTLLQSLGVPVERQATSQLADGGRAPVDIVETIIRLEGQTFHTPVIFAEGHDPALLGVVALGQALVPVAVMRL